MKVLLTTSRKPSKKTRSLAKALARFMNWRYVNRGKMNMEDIFEMCEDKLAIIKEIKGNPSILEIFDRKRNLLLRMRFNVSNIEKVRIDDSPVVFVGKVPFDPLILNAIPQDRAGLKISRKIETPKRIYVRKRNGMELEFYFRDVMVFKMKVRSLHAI